MKPAKCPKVISTINSLSTLPLGSNIFPPNLFTHSFWTFSVCVLSLLIPFFLYNLPLHLSALGRWSIFTNSPLRQTSIFSSAWKWWRKEGGGGNRDRQRVNSLDDCQASVNNPLILEKIQNQCFLYFQCWTVPLGHANSLCRHLCCTQAWRWVCRAAWLPSLQADWMLGCDIPTELHLYHWCNTASTLKSYLGWG